MRVAMPELRPAQERPKAKKITKEELRKNPLLRKLIRERAKEVREVREAKKASEFDFD